MKADSTNKRESPQLPEDTPNAKQIIKVLLERLDLTEADLLSGLSLGGKGFSKKVAKRWIEGTSQPRTKGREALAQYFRRYNPDVSEYWFEAPFETIEHKLNLGSKAVRIELPNIRHNSQSLHDLSAALAGDWILKRFAFDNSGRVAREILTIYPYEEGHIAAKIYGITSTGVGQRDGYLEQEFNGQVDLLGELLVITTAHFGNHCTRYRSIILKKPLEIGRMERLHWGIVTGYSSVKAEPASARTLMLRPNQIISQPPSNRKRHMGFRTIEKHEVAKNRLLSNDIKAHHVSKNEDFVLTTSQQDLHELADTDKDILKHLE